MVYAVGKVATVGVKKVIGRGGGSGTKEAAVGAEGTTTEAAPRIRKTANIDLPPTRSTGTVGKSNTDVASVPSPRRARTDAASNTPGIKRPVATAPSTSPKGKDVLRVGRTTVTGPGGERFREYSTAEGPSLLLPARGPRPSSPPRRPRPSVSPAATSHPTEVLHRVAAASRR
ncbi:hypothetical protein BJF84_24395 [Rhodococcus sp. CUA-806]|nr:hypothetical protein BJF84_24395 [Rhodococcus sp. CUA-806]